MSVGVPGAGTHFLKTAGVSEVRQWTGHYQAKITAVNDPLQQQRVTLYVPQVLGNAISNWATPAFPLSAAPPVGATVLAAFTGGDINRPMYMLTPATVAATALSLGNVDITGTLTNTGLASQLTAIQNELAAIQVNLTVSNNLTVDNQLLVEGDTFLEGSQTTISGNTYVNEDLHVEGTLWGTAGTLTVGDFLQLNNSGVTESGQTFNSISATQGEFLAGMTEMFTGSDAVPADVTGYSATGLTSTTVAPFWNNGGDGATYINTLATAINGLITVVAYIQSELNAHGFSSN